MTGVSTSCGACKFLRRKCRKECVFAPYYSYDEAVVHFTAVHKVFGASNVSRLLVHLPEQFRGEAALTLSFEATARIRDPVYGCVAYIHALQQQVVNLQDEIEVIGNHMANSMRIGVVASHCGGSQATNNNNFMHDSMPPLTSKENQMMNLQEKYWNNNNNNSSSINNQVEPTHAENGSCSQMINLPAAAAASFCEWEGHNLYGNAATGNNGPRECLLEGLFNPLTFDNYSLFGFDA